MKKKTIALEISHKYIKVASGFVQDEKVFLAAQNLHCFARAFSSCGKWGLRFIAVRGFLTAVASLVAEHRF